jgi:hypothetical protein
MYYFLCKLDFFMPSLYIVHTAQAHTQPWTARLHAGHLRRRTTRRYSKFSDQRMERGGADAALTFTGLTAVTLTSGVSAYRAAATGDVASAAFVCASYAALLLLFRSLRAYERLPPPPPWAADDDDGRRLMRRRVKREVWALCTMLTVLFAWKVAAAMPSWPVKAAVWAMAVVTAVGGFLALFRHP